PAAPAAHHRRPAALGGTLLLAAAALVRAPAPGGACLRVPQHGPRDAGSTREENRPTMPQQQPTSPGPVSRKPAVNAEEMRKRLGIGVSFDILERPVEIGGRKAAFYFVDGFIKDKVTADIYASLQDTERGEMVPN